MRQLLVPLQAEAGIFSGTCLASDSGMPVLKKSALETYLKVSYRLGINPLPALRDASGQAIVFSHDPDRLIFPEEEPGTIVFIVNSRGEISVREAYEPQPHKQVEARHYRQPFSRRSLRENL